MPDRPNLRCKNCWRPYAMHQIESDPRIQDDAYGFWCPDRKSGAYEPDTSPEAAVYAAVEELIAVYKRDEWDSGATVEALNKISTAASRIEPDAARSERTKHD